MPCDRTDCNNRGSCLGTKKAPLCFCELGSSGLRCDQSNGYLQCDSKTACSGNGICIGSSLQNSCICNLGFTGTRCEVSPNSGNDLLGLFNWFGSGTDPMGSLPSIFGNGLSSLGLSNLLKSLPTANLPQPQPNNMSPLKAYPERSYSTNTMASVGTGNVIEPLHQVPLVEPSGSGSPPYFPQPNDVMVNAVGSGSYPVVPYDLPQSNPIVAANYSMPLNQGLDVCGPQDCNNQGVCMGSKTLPVCLCYVGFTGTRCETNVFDNGKLYKLSFIQYLLISAVIGDSGHSIICSASDCNNNGVCLGTKGSFTCACKLGFSGRRCESSNILKLDSSRDINFFPAPYPLCDASDCSNNGLCIGTKGGFTCACHLGFSGERCEKGFP